MVSKITEQSPDSVDMAHVATRRNRPRMPASQVAESRPTLVSGPVARLTDSMVLTPQELEAYTGHSRPSWQARQLDVWGIPYRRRDDRTRTLMVLRVHVEHMPTQIEPQVRSA